MDYGGLLHHRLGQCNSPSLNPHWPYSCLFMIVITFGLYDGVMFFLNSSGFLDFLFVHDNNDLMVILHIGILNDVHGF